MNIRFAIILLLVYAGIFQTVSADDNVQTRRPINKPLLRQTEFLKNRFGDDIPDNSLRIKAASELMGMQNLSEKYYEQLQADMPEWKNIGPFDLGGRVRTIAVHPANPDIVYIGAAAGGIWKSTNGGIDWKPIFDFENATSFGSLAIDPNNPNIIYAATGEMIIGGGIPYLGNGVFKSTDAGNSWFQIGLTEVAAFSKIYVHPLNSNLIYAAGAIRNGGVYRSTDGGNIWTKLYDGNVTDLCLNPQNPDEILAGVNITGVIYSDNGGSSWEVRSDGLTNLGGRVSVQSFIGNTNILYCLIERKDGKGAIFKSVNTGKTWSLVLSGNNDFFSSQGYYNNFIAIHPANANLVLAGGIDLWRTSDGGQNWKTVNDNTQSGRMHVDQHHAVFAPSNNSIVYEANDGGVYKSDNAGNNWYNMNKGLMITQFYAMTIDTKQKNRNFGGTQDNGTVGNPGSTWKMAVGGDGFDSFLHPNYPNILFGEIYYGDVFKYDINNDDYNFINEGLQSEDIGAWHSPFIFDDNTHTMYLGRHALYASYNYGDFFFQITPYYTHQFTAIAPSRKNSRIMYSGNKVGQMILTTNGGTSWADVKTTGLPGKYINAIITSKQNDSIVYTAFSGYGSRHIFKSTNLGLSWSGIDKSLPDVPVNSLVMHPENESIIFAGTDIGVFVTYNDGRDWMPFGKNLPRTPVLDLKFHTNRIILPKLTLRAATHGRSVWEIEIPDHNVSEPVIVSPAGGEYYIGDSQTDISWFGFDYPVMVEFSPFTGAAYQKITDSVFQNNLNWNLPDIKTFTAKFRVTSLKSGISRKSENFSISPKYKGAILAQTSLGFSAYGIKFTGKDLIWVVDYRNKSILKYSLKDYSLIKRIVSPVDGYYTDIAVNEGLDSIYLHKMSDENGSNPEIILLDSNGTLLRRITSPADYPMGLAVEGNILYATERNGQKRIFRFYINNNFTNDVMMTNPVTAEFGPRCIAINNNNIHQVSTYFNSNVLAKSEITVYPKNSQTILETIPLIERTGIMNARGIDIDPIDGNYWVSSFTGGLFKIAAGSSTTDIIINENIELFSIFPNPAKDKITVNLNNLNTGSSEIIIINSLGQEIRKFEALSNQQSIDFNISDLPSGVYLIILKYNGFKTFKSKFVKM